MVVIVLLQVQSETVGYFLQRLWHKSVFAKS